MKTGFKEKRFSPLQWGLTATISEPKVGKDIVLGSPFNKNQKKFSSLALNSCRKLHEHNYYEGESRGFGILCGGEEILPGTLHAVEETLPGTLHGGEEVLPGTLHGGEEILPGTLHGGEEVLPGTFHGGEKIPSTTLHSHSAATYRTLDGLAYFRFNYIDMGWKFEIDIIDQPSYENRAPDASLTHRLPSARGGKRICIAVGHEPTTLEAAQNISMQWAELTQRYIMTGQTIDDQITEKARVKAVLENVNHRRSFWDFIFG